LIQLKKKPTMNLLKQIKISRYLLFVGGIFMMFLLGANSLLAQTESFSFDVYPKNPDPYSMVSVSISSFSVDLDRAQITWDLNGDLVLSGVGEKKFSVQVGDVGEVSILKVEATFRNGNKLNKTLALQPSYLDLLWEATDSYTPPFYKGKALPSPEATIKVVATPEIKSFGGTTYKPSTLIYEWKKGIETQQGVSGFNKQYFSFKHNFFDKEQGVRVSVSSPDKRSTAENSVTIPFGKPFIAVYTEDIQEGVDFSREVSRQQTILNGKTNLVVVPYFFSVDTAIDGDLEYVWKINGKETQNTSQKNKLSIVKSGQEGGLAGLEVVIESITKLFQESRNSFSLDLR
jgi:hypothetical protein